MLTAHATVYVIDDGLSGRDNLVPLLRSAGLRTRRYRSGRALLRADGLKKSPCVVADVRRRVLGDAELEDALRAAPPDVSAVLITPRDLQEAFHWPSVDDQALVDAIQWILVPDDVGASARSTKPR
jgi:CheY-like chemotaxis protein